MLFGENCILIQVLLINSLLRNKEVHSYHSQGDLHVSEIKPNGNWDTVTRLKIQSHYPFRHSHIQANSIWFPQAVTYQDTGQFLLFLNSVIVWNPTFQRNVSVSL